MCLFRIKASQVATTCLAAEAYFRLFLDYVIDVLGFQQN
jgi:hypothetical protein